MSKVRCVLVIWLVAIGLGACGGQHPDVAVGPESADAGTAVAGHPARRFSAAVEEVNLLLDNREAARDYLRRKLIALLATRLVELGFDPGRAADIASRGELSAFGVRGHREKVFGRGEQAGKLERVELWDVSGRLQVVLGDAQVEQVLERLDRLSVTSLDGAEALAGYLDRLAALGPDRRKLTALREKLGVAWANLLEPLLEIQLQVPVEPVADYFTILEKGAARLSRFHRAYPGHAASPRLEKLFTLAAVKALHTVEVCAGNHAELDAILERLGGLCQPDLSGVMPYLMRDVELAWRDRLEKLDNQKTPFPRMRADFVQFLKRFPKSDFYPELELRFLARWTDHLAARKASNIDDLGAFLDEVDLLTRRFPSAGGVESVQRALGTACQRVLSAVEVPDRKTSARVNELLQRCRPRLPPGEKSAALERRLAGIQAELIRRKHDREEREALRDLTFFVSWDRAIRALPWGRSLGDRIRQDWAGEDVFGRLWKQGRDAGSACRCSLDPDEPCRLFEEAGTHGGFEVVARFYRDQLAGVDLCQVYTGVNVEPLYRFYKRRYRVTHGNRQAVVFLAGGSPGAGGDGVRFGKPAGIQVTLERSRDTVTVRYRYGPVLARRERDASAERARREEQKRERRSQRVKAGWKAGDCVRWDCADVIAGEDCAYSGNVLERKGARYRVRVLDAEDDPAARGADLWIEEEEIVDCH